MRIYRWLFGTALLLTSFILGAFCARFGWPPYPQMVKVYLSLRPDAHSNRLFADRAALLAAYRADTRAAQLVLAGDSQFARGDWPALLPDRRTALRAIDGETASQLLNRPDTLRAPGASHLAILIGINDLISGDSPRLICQRIEQLVNKTAQSMQVIVLGVLPTRRAGWNEQVRALNHCLRLTIPVRGARFIEAFADSEPLDHALSVDEIHLSAAGYRQLAAALEKALVL